MVLFELVDGRKGDGDVLVLITAYREPLTLTEWLYIGDSYLDSEASYYPVSEGYLGKGMLVSALVCLACGVPLRTVLRKFGLDRKTKKLNIIYRRKPKPSFRITEKTNLAELL